MSKISFKLQKDIAFLFHCLSYKDNREVIVIVQKSLIHHSQHCWTGSIVKWNHWCLWHSFDLTVFSQVWVRLWNKTRMKSVAHWALSNSPPAAICPRSIEGLFMTVLQQHTTALKLHPARMKQCELAWDRTDTTSTSGESATRNKSYEPEAARRLFLLPGIDVWEFVAVARSLPFSSALDR